MSPYSVPSTGSEVDYKENSDVSSTFSSAEIDIFSEDTDEETDEVAGETLEPYQYEPVETSDTEPSDCEDESSSDEEPMGILPEDMSW